MRHYTGYDVTDNKLKVAFHRDIFDVATIAEGVASIVIGQVGGACSVLVDNVTRTITGTSTVSGHGGSVV